MFLKKPELTAGSRPTLSQDETLLSVQDGVGLYEGCMLFPFSKDEIHNTNTVIGNTK